MKKLKISAAMVAVFFGWSLGWSFVNAAENVVPESVTAKTQATVNEKTTSKTASQSSTKTEKTEHSFEDLLVQGKYHFSDEAVTTVEEDKVLDSLLGIRTDFKDKIEQSAGRY
ncbi:MAG: hypothetical protein JNL11_07480 [Bdellovibrionaceae bacterium]|nr:hypothetical protein [Pseudobdellovibrionaceae bacterium]